MNNTPMDPGKIGTSHTKEMQRGRFSGSGFWLGGLVLLLTAGGLFFAFGPRPEPPRVTVQHILISFAGARTLASRTKAEAEKRAGEILARAQNGEEFAALMKFSDDPSEGTFSLTNHGVAPQGNEFNRSAMVKSFGDVSFKLRVGAIRMVPFDPKDSPWGFHIIKRIQ